MATVQVSSFDEFVTAAAVEGDTVVLPVKEVWNMNEEYPEGYTGEINLFCAEIIGNGTEIRNLHIYGRFWKKAALTINDLKITNFVCEADYGQNRGKAFIAYATNASGNLTLYKCVFSGLCSTGIRKFAVSNLILNRSSLNVDFTASGTGGGIFPISSAKYSRIKQNSPNLTGDQSTFDFGACAFCEINLYAPQLTGVSALYVSACKIIGGLVNVETVLYKNTARPFISIYRIGTMDEDLGGTYIVGVTNEQMQDAEYLASIGFPIGVSSA